MKIKFLAKRGNTYQFSRRVPDDVRPTLGINHWRWSLRTDSLTEAEITCRKDSVQTDEIIEQVRDGTYRQFSDNDIDDLAVRWSTQFQSTNRENIAATVFPDVIPLNEPIGEEEKTPVFPSRKELEKSVARWAEQIEGTPAPKSADWDKLVDACLDEYLVGNPELSDAWIGILAEQGLDFADTHGSFIKVVQRPKKTNPRNLLSAVFADFIAGDHGLADNTVTEYRLSVDRFISVHGDLDINDITKEHVKHYRDLLRMMPSRPPNAVRILPIAKQVAWAEGKELQTLAQAAINKNFLGVKAALNHAYNETSILADPHWRNPFDGFSKKPKRPANPIRRFTDEQIKLVFSSGLFQPKTAEKFWVPLLLFYTGARLTEISQLHVSDVSIDPIPHIVLENLEDEDPVSAKKLKNESSHRTVPLHRDLLDLGFLEYVAKMRDFGKLHVFPNLPHQKPDGVGDLVSRDFISRFREYGANKPESGLDSKSLVTHSLRHTFRNAGHYLKDETYLKIVMGHYVPGVSIQVYGKEAYMMPDLLAHKVMNHIKLPSLELDFLRGQAEKWLKALC